MECPKCNEDFLSSDNSMGYGDVMCPHCKHVIYAESDEDFEARIYKKDSDENISR